MIAVQWTLESDGSSTHIQNFEDTDTRPAAEFIMSLRLSKKLTLVSVSADGDNALDTLNAVARQQADLIKEIGN